MFVCPTSGVNCRILYSDGELVRVVRRNGVTAICGYVNSKNAFGGMTGPQRFIAGGTVGLEEDFAPGEMDNAWALLC